MKILALFSIIMAAFPVIQLKPGQIYQYNRLKIQCVTTKDSLHCHNYGKFPRLDWMLFQNKLTVWKRDRLEDQSAAVLEVEIP